MRVLELPVAGKLDERQEDAVRTLTGVLERARAGDVTGVAVAYELGDGRWATVSSYTVDQRVMGAMLIELGLRNLGFKAEG